jgi:hypothetical protein
MVSKHVSGIIMAIIRRMVQNGQRLWCTALAVMQKTRGEEAVGVQLLGMVSKHVSGIIMPIIRTDNTYGVQHWPCCSRLEEKRWFGMHLLGLVSRLDVFIGVSKCFGHHHAHHQENGTKPTTPMVYSTGRAAGDSCRRGGSVCTCWDWFHETNPNECTPNHQNNRNLRGVLACEKTRASRQIT